MKKQPLEEWIFQTGKEPLHPMETAPLKPVYTPLVRKWDLQEIVRGAIEGFRTLQAYDLSEKEQEDVINLNIKSLEKYLA
jgi:hypothetical protein